MNLSSRMKLKYLTVDRNGHKTTGRVGLESFDRLATRMMIYNKDIVLVLPWRWREPVFYLKT